MLIETPKHIHVSVVVPTRVHVSLDAQVDRWAGRARRGALVGRQAVRYKALVAPRAGPQGAAG